MLWVKVINDATGTLKKGNYTYVVGVNELTLAEGKITGHQRAKGWLPLLRKVMRLAAKQERFKPNETLPTAQLEIIPGLEGPRE